MGRDVEDERLLVVVGSSIAPVNGKVGRLELDAELKNFNHGFDSNVVGFKLIIIFIASFSGKSGRVCV